VSSAALLLRAGSAADIAAVDAIMAAAFDPRYGEAWTRNQCLGVLAMPNVHLILAELDERAVGFAMTRAVLDEAELLLLAVIPGARRRGVGSALLRRTLAEVCAATVTRLHLEVRRDNPAVDLYRSAGFEQVGERRGYYRGPEGEVRDALSFSRVV
jgi:[ribosomal protein S18]-alanine N-acetyltransferase